MNNIIGGEIEILDVWGEGRIVDGSLVTGFPNAININKKGQKISNGPDRGKNIPNLSPVDDYNWPEFNIKKNSCRYITLMGAPLTLGTAKEIIRVFIKRPGYGCIFFYGLDSHFLNLFRGVAAEHSITHDGRRSSSSLKYPFNEITIDAVDIFSSKKDEL